MTTDVMAYNFVLLIFGWYGNNSIVMGPFIGPLYHDDDDDDDDYGAIGGVNF
jgi:hypothetical protein